MLHLKFGYEIETELPPYKVAGKLYYVLEGQERYRIISVTDDRIVFDHDTNIYYKNNSSFSNAKSLMLKRMDDGVIVINKRAETTIVRLRYRLDITGDVVILCIGLVVAFCGPWAFLWSIPFLLQLCYRIWNVKSIVKNILRDALD